MRGAVRRASEGGRNFNSTDISVPFQTRINFQDDVGSPTY